jgi:hypothetical protein
VVVDVACTDRLPKRRLPTFVSDPHPSPLLSREPRPVRAMRRLHQSSFPVAENFPSAKHPDAKPQRAQHLSARCWSKCDVRPKSFSLGARLAIVVLGQLRLKGAPSGGLCPPASRLHARAGWPRGCLCHWTTCVSEPAVVGLP